MAVAAPRPCVKRTIPAAVPTAHTTMRTLKNGVRSFPPTGSARTVVI